MILYLSSNQNTNLLDFERWRSEEDRQVPTKKMVGSFVLKQFVIYDMRNFSHITDIVLDRIAFNDTDEEFAEAIKEFLTMYEARVTVIYEGLAPSDKLFQMLLKSGVGNFVCSREIGEIQQELTECLSETGMERYLSNTLRKEKPERYRFECVNIKIAVCSSQPRMGATTTAIGLCSWLSHVGATVAYIEANESNHLSWLAKNYEMDPIDHGYMYEGVRYCREWQDVITNFIVYDIGSVELNSVGQNLIQAADIRIMLCGTKPYELTKTSQMRSRWTGLGMYVLCPFTSTEIREDIITVFQNDNHQVLFPEYQPELTNGEPNRVVYKTMIAKYITGA